MEERLEREIQREREERGEVKKERVGRERGKKIYIERGGRVGERG